MNKLIYQGEGVRVIERESELPDPHDPRRFRAVGLRPEGSPVLLGEYAVHTLGIRREIEPYLVTYDAQSVLALHGLSEALTREDPDAAITIRLFDRSRTNDSDLVQAAGYAAIDAGGHYPTYQFAPDAD